MTDTPRRTAQIGLIQVKPRYDESVTVEGCLDELLQLAEQCLKDGADLVFMPEAYQYRLARRHIPRGELSKTYSETYKQRCSQLARKYNAYVVPWDYEIDEQENVYNVSYVLDRNGVEIGRYRKVHLTRGETKVLTYGRDFPVFDLDFGKVGIMICFDNYFPESARILALRGAELILFPLFGDTLNPQWEIKLRARAIDNSVYVATCHLHADPGTSFTGMVSPTGEIIAKVENEGTYQVVEIDLSTKIMTNTRAVKGSCEDIKQMLLKLRRMEAYQPLLEDVPQMNWEEIEFFNKEE
ncbi:carbon-nitrogen hydrolase family protein [Paenibacillus qinlingensis]|uniref:Amidohydrolase n=1 Tax=Paenibacillus qinlingensis TaxID=1837343 RepID=A0ABU1NRG7_9BACL|nr:carbon-nitrogen hydrolase family protein [Paenibacillus qinlingensis]MDR6550080.1 putative amidohydrolase [Paenibacillus qinlingensis]